MKAFCISTVKIPLTPKTILELLIQLPLSLGTHDENRVKQGSQQRSRNSDMFRKFSEGQCERGSQEVSSVKQSVNGDHRKWEVNLNLDLTGAEWSLQVSKRCWWQRRHQYKGPGVTAQSDRP